MSMFVCSGHWRTNRYGNQYWVNDHTVWRDDWSRVQYLAAQNSVKRIEIEAKGRTACFINRNAYCPVCGSPVYYYQNVAGSRVFFDELGPPWPKHPCTDRGSKVRVLSVEPTLKSLSDKNASFTEASEAGVDIDTFFARKFGQSPWRLMRVVKSFRNAKINLIAAESLDDARRVYFQFETRVRFLQDGDIFARKGAKVSLLNRSSLEPREIKVAIIRKAHDFVDRLRSR